MKFTNLKQLMLALLIVCVSFVFTERLHGQGLDDDFLKALARPVEARGDADEKKAEEQTSSKFEPYRTGGGHLIEIGPYRIDNLWQGQERKGVVADDWRYFMHGMKDAAAYPLAWDEFINEDQEKFLDKETALQTPVKISNVPPIVLKGGESLIPTKPLLKLNTLASFRGATLRFYIWIKGEGTGARTSLWEGAPQVCFYLKDSQGSVVGSYPSVFCTRGTFPWFCYQIVVDVPYTLATSGGIGAIESAEAIEDGPVVSWADMIGLRTDEKEPEDGEIVLPSAGGLYVQLKNPATGKAWFSTISFEKATQKNTPVKDALVDPVTGSLAPNADHDELPMHIFFGLADLRKWNFLKGNAVFGDLTRIDGLKAYLNKAVGDWSHMLHAVPYLVQIYNVGTQQNQTPEFEKGWLETLGAWLESMRSKSTGLWKLNGRDSLELTEAIVSNCYAPADIPRPGEVANQTDWLSIGGKPVTNAAAMAEAVLGAQEHDPKDAGVLAGWTRYAFQPRDLKASDPKQMAFEFCSTNAAMAILAECMPLVDDTMKRRIAASMKAAWEYAMRTVFRNDGCWYQNDAVQQLDGPAFALDFLNSTQWLEPRVATTVAKPNVKAEFVGEGVRVTWAEPADNAVSLRIYALDKDSDASILPTDRVVGIIQKPAKGIKGLDPLLAAKQICEAGKETWGMTPEKAGADYLAKAMKDLNPRVKVSKNSLDIQVSKPEALSDVVFWIVAVQPYGEMSKPMEVAEKTEE
ncbi:MAG: hypothetical protein IKX30_12635 [Victivallales bacterium]|nr:hypothetical protein [Victivallales bacterium]